MENWPNDEIPSPPFFKEFSASGTRYRRIMKSKLGQEYFQTICTSDVDMHCSKSALKLLKRVTLMDVIHQEKALGTYFILRVLTEPDIDCAFFHVIVEDHDGNVAFLHLLPFLRRWPCWYFPPGTVLIVKEPVLALVRQFACKIVCHTLTDVVRVRANTRVADMVHLEDIKWKQELVMESTTVKSASEWNIEGNEDFSARNFAKALECYLSALNIVKDDTQLTQEIQLNVSSAYLELGYYESCLEHALKVENVIKSYLLAGRSYYFMSNFQEASNQFRLLLGLDSAHAEGLKWFFKTKDRLKEKKLMTINEIVKLKMFARENPDTAIDCADFFGSVKLASVRAKNVGVVATQDIPPGTVLMVYKALCVNKGDLLSAEEEKYNLNGMATATCNLADELALKMYKNPKTVGTRVYRILQKRFGPENAQQYCDGSDKELIIDIKQIIELVCLSSCRIVSRHITTGFFEYLNVTNLSCVSNATCRTYNDVMVYRSLKPIKRGEEVLIDNMVRFNIFETAKPGYKSGDCRCEICDLDRLELPEVLQTRLILIRKLCGMICCEKFSGLNRLVKKLENTYTTSKREKYQIDLTVPYLKLSNYLHAKKGFGEAIATTDKALATLGLDRYTLQRCALEMPNAPVFPDNVYVTSFIVNIIDDYIRIYTASNQVEKIAMWKQIRKNVASLF